MLFKRNYTLIFSFFILLLIPSISFSQINPVNAFDSLFIDVQLNSIFNDQKKFPDCIPKYPPDTIIQKYNLQKKSTPFNLKNFVAENFDTLFTDTTLLLQHIHNLWIDLTRYPEKQNPNSSSISLPSPYVVPGGRFQEMYYWDSYFTMLGLAISDRYDLIRNMIDDFSFLIRKYGHIPNGNRTYYLSRSQPPYFSLMVELLAEKDGDSVYLKYLDCMQQEYNFWMAGLANLNKNNHYSQRIVELQSDEMLNRYWDSLSTPRPESYKQDFELFTHSGRGESFYRDIRATAESGWDFSSRWMKENTSLKNIHTTEILPIDLNCLLYHLELTLKKCYELKKDKPRSDFYQQKCNARKKLINSICWNKENKYYFDYNFIDHRQSDAFTLAGVYPLFFNLAGKNQANLVAQTIRRKFLKEGGVVTTLINTGEQWDDPNGWAPLQWITYHGLKNYGINALADSIANRWLSLNMKVYFATGKMMEKYDVVNMNKPGGGGEYPLQDGFGWTNGVFLKLWDDLYK